MLRVASRHGDAGDAERVGNQSEPGDRLVQGTGRGCTGASRVAEKHGLQVECCWRVRHACEQAVEVVPQAGPVAEVADAHPGVERFEQRVVRRGELAWRHLEGGEEELVRRVDAARRGKQVI